ncbi:hypothetical protein [Mycobacterium sp.]|uniref:hypothetical protein n=1 Tax=Mycobacterium sp. TaxID=1785 RepID=UPI003D6C2F11
MTTGHTDSELRDAVTGIKAALDVVDLMVVLLKICRRHASAVMAASQDEKKREQLWKRAARLEEAAAKTFTSKGLSSKTRTFAIDTLNRASDLALTARALALGVDMAMQDLDPKAYSKLCAKWGTRVLQEGDPYPTPSADLDSMYGPGGFSARPRANAGTAVDRVDGLALWPSSPLRVIYDTDAGTHLDDALGQTVDILAVSPNSNLGDFDFALSANKSFRLQVKDTNGQDGIVQRALQKASALNADILVTPELSCTTSTVGLIVKTLAGLGDRRPRIVIAGGSHIRIGKKHWNRLSTIYTGHNPYVVTHDKIGRYAISLPGGQECEENISRSTELRIHAGINWSMIPLICADFLTDYVVDAVSDLCPRLVVVPSMSSKTGDFGRRMGEVISKTQALVAVVNGPPEWPSGKPPYVTKAPVVVIGLPLADSRKWLIERSAKPSAKAPYTVLFRSLKRTARLTSGQ